MRNGGYIIPAELWMSDCLRAFINTKKGCVIDVGVNVGLYLVKLKAITENINYFGVDANPACTFYTQELIRINKFSSARLFTVALGEYAEILTFYASSLGDGTGSLIKDHQVQKKMDYSFDTMTLTGDEFVDMLGLQEGISVIKIDVEEAEIHVLRGLQNTIKKYTPYIYMEILYAETKGQKDRSIEICDNLQSMDYSILGVHVTDRTLDVVDKSAVIGRSYEQEYIFVPNIFLGSFISSIARNESGIDTRKTCRL